MKSKIPDYNRLMHITDAIHEIQSYLKGINFQKFENDSKTRFACIKQLEIIGEASNHLSNALKTSNRHIQWDSIIALRHILVHEYYGIQNDVLWKIITVHLPEFHKQLLLLISKIKPYGM